MNYRWRFVTLYRRQGSRPSPWKRNAKKQNSCLSERLLLNHAQTLGFLTPGGEEFNLGPETRLDCSELLCHKVFFKYKGDRESF